MEVIEAASAASEAPLQVAAGRCLHPEPEWVTRAADEFGWTWARQNWQRASRVPGAWFDAAKGDQVVERSRAGFRSRRCALYGKPFRRSSGKDHRSAAGRMEGLTGS